MDVEHIIPEALGGLTVEENLWLACSSCNSFKGDRPDAFDPETGVFVRFFHPREDAWHAHFAWVEQGTYIVGLTAIGRATVATLQLNRDLLVGARALWRATGLHPPQD